MTLSRSEPTKLFARQVAVHLENMLNQIDEFNQQNDPAWRTADYAWYRALYVRAAAALGQLESWGPQGPTSEQLAAFNEELTVLWRYGLSMELVDEADKQTLAKRLTRTFTSARAKHRPFPSSQVAVVSEKRRRLLDKLVARAAEGRFCVDSFVGLLTHSRMDFSTLCLSFGLSLAD